MINQEGHSSSTNLINTYQHSNDNNQPLQQIATNSIKQNIDNAAWQQIMLTVMNRKRLECG